MPSDETVPQSPASEEMPETLSDASEAVLRDLAECVRADHHFASVADHPAMGWRVDADVEGTVEPVRARLSSLEAEIARLTAELSTARERADRAEQERDTARLDGAREAIKAAQAICESRASSLMNQTPVRRISESNEASKCAIAIGSMWRDALPPDDPLYVKWTLLTSTPTPTPDHA